MLDKDVPTEVVKREIVKSRIEKCISDERSKANRMMADGASNLMLWRGWAEISNSVYDDREDEVFGKQSVVVENDEGEIIGAIVETGGMTILDKDVPVLVPALSSCIPLIINVQMSSGEKKRIIAHEDQTGETVPYVFDGLRKLGITISKAVALYYDAVGNNRVAEVIGDIPQLELQRVDRIDEYGSVIDLYIKGDEFVPINPRYAASSGDMEKQMSKENWRKIGSD